MHIEDCLPGMSTSSAHKHMAEDTAVLGKSGATNKGTAGTMGVSAGGGPAARAGSCFYNIGELSFTHFWFPKDKTHYASVGWI